MTIRKTGSATGQVTGVDQSPEQGITSEAARSQPWSEADDQELTAENEAADQDGD